MVSTRPAVYHSILPSDSEPTPSRMQVRARNVSLLSLTGAMGHTRSNPMGP
jgi:hypothetical protein